MTDRIDLDDIDLEDDDEPAATDGDWRWRGEGDPDGNPEPPSGDEKRTPPWTHRDPGGITNHPLSAGRGGG